MVVEEEAAIKMHPSGVHLGGSYPANFLPKEDADLEITVNILTNWEVVAVEVLVTLKAAIQASAEINPLAAGTKAMAVAMATANHSALAGAASVAMAGSEVRLLEGLGGKCSSSGSQTKSLA